MDDFAASVRDELRLMRSDTREEFQALRTEMHDGFRALRAEMHEEFRAMRADIMGLQRQIAQIGWTLAIALIGTMVALVVPVA